MATFLGYWVAGWLSSIHQARNVADLAALASAAEFEQSGSDSQACDAARSTALSNGARLVDCEVSGNSGSFVVEVTVTTELKPVMFGKPNWVAETSKAGVI